MTQPVIRHHDQPNHAPRKRALTYLRVSSAGQVDTDYDPEGISLPAQRAAVQRRAAELDAEIVGEYVEPGRSATSTDKRPKFQEMMARLKSEHDIGYIIVYARSRLHRNSIDAAITKRELREAGAVLVSVMDHTEDSAIGDLVGTVLDGVNEYQSRASGADIAYKMGQKIKHGGSVGIAPIGYLNVREMFEGREVRTVVVDPVRGPLVTMAFELYASGAYGFHALIQALTDAGLRSRPNRRYPAGPISINALGKLLRNRYYLGYVSHSGQEYQGRHQPLVTPELFARVQQMLETRRIGGTRERRHNHYLKGTVWCHRSKERLMIMRGKSHTGELYFYYFCKGRQDHTCDLPYLPVARVETGVLDAYATIALPLDLRDRIAARMDEAMGEAATISADMHHRLTGELKRLDKQEDRFLDLVGDDDWPQEKIAARLRTIRDERSRLARQLDDTDRPDLDTGRDTLAYLIDLLAEPQELYRQAGKRARQVLNQAFFRRLYLDADDDGPYVASDELTAALAPLVDLARRPALGAPYNDNGATQVGDAVTSADLLRTSLRGGGSSKTTVVELRGIEPRTSCMPCKRSTN
ncbi:conserved hypothetical protein [Actinacidiphila cocklensis]|uniref:Recombinase domain-containing protein n=1 Tax=Actinacidiphila cocklensis TaxID=887465 RepID=A0A9W4GS16_9ACTN|nr:conserved hypothetical protein [Actinacidiphila cocklensis]